MPQDPDSPNLDSPPVNPAQGPAEQRPTTSEAAETKTSWLVRVSIFNPHAVIVMALFIVVIGFACLVRIPVDLLPAYKTPAVQVLTLYPGMPSEFVDRGMTWRLERWLTQAEGVERQESRSMIGVSIIRNYFRDDIDSNTALSQISALALSDLYYLPPGTILPMPMLFDPTATLPTPVRRGFGNGRARWFGEDFLNRRRHGGLGRRRVRPRSDGEIKESRGRFVGRAPGRHRIKEDSIPCAVS